MSMNVVTLLYLVASVCFIQALKGLSHPTTSIRGNLFGMVGMAIAILTTAALIVQLAGGKALGMGWVLLGLLVGGVYGAYRAKTGLAVMVEGDKKMFNPYGIIAVNPEKYKNINYKGAMQLIDWITSAEGQKMIGEYRVSGEQVFFPDAK